MEDQLILAIAVLRRIGLVALVVLTHSEILRRLGGRRHLEQVATGLLFGAGGVVSMLDPVPIAPGIWIDSGNVLVSLAGPFGGWPGTLIATSIIGANRLALGGAGMHAALVSMTVAAAVGLAFARWTKQAPEHLRLSSLAILGAATGACTLGTLLLPAPYRSLAGGIGFSNLIGILVFGTLLVRERRRVIAEAALSRAALTDPLTELSNRRAFRESLDRAVAGANRHGSPIALLTMDVDGFKTLNDAHGHEAGDAGLVALAQVLRHSCRESDLPARLGGDEFSVLLAGATPEGAREAAERIRAAAEGVRISGAVRQLRLSVSVGVVCHVSGMSADELVKAADDALYEAKRGGRNRVAFTSAYRRIA